VEHGLVKLLKYTYMREQISKMRPAGPSLIFNTEELFDTVYKTLKVSKLHRKEIVGYFSATPSLY
jgi:hypothetical protein